MIPIILVIAHSLLVVGVAILVARNPDAEAAVAWAFFLLTIPRRRPSDRAERKALSGEVRRPAPSAKSRARSKRPDCWKTAYCVRGSFRVRRQYGCLRHFFADV